MQKSTINAYVHQCPVYIAHAQKLELAIWFKYICEDYKSSRIQVCMAIITLQCLNIAFY